RHAGKPACISNLFPAKQTWRRLEVRERREAMQEPGKSSRKAEEGITRRAFLQFGSLTLGSLSLAELLSGCSRPAQTSAPPVVSPTVVSPTVGVPITAAKLSMDTPGLPMPQRLELLNANINLDEVIYQNRRKAERLRTLVEGEKEETLRAFLLPQYAEQ